MNPLFLSGYGLSINVDGRKLIIFNPSENKRLVYEPHRFPYDSLIISGYYGKISFESLRWLDVHGISFSLLNFRGENFTQTLPTETKFGELRVKQYSAYLNPDKRLEFASAIIREKTRLQREFLDYLSNYYSFFQSLPKEESNFLDFKTLLNYEARTAERYFDSFSQIIKQVSRGKFEFKGRVSSYASWSIHAPDPINALLNYGYSILESYARKFLRSCGLDLNVGFIHELNRSKEPLVYDFQELFRWLVDYSIITLFEKRLVSKKDFHYSSDYTVVLKPSIAKALVNEISLNFSRKVNFAGANRSYDMILLEIVKRLCKTLLSSRPFTLGIPMISPQEKLVNLDLKQNILSITPSQRKALGINKSTLWYQKQAVLKGSPFKLYSKTLSKIQSQAI